MKSLEYTAKTLSVLHGLAGDAGPQLRNNDWPILAALTPPILAAFALGELGAWVVSELARQVRIHEKRPASPSLRGTPTPREIADAWGEQPRGIATCLRIGSRLADLDPTLDHTLRRTADRCGRLVIRARPGGIKGWLADRRVGVAYSTVMRYKKLAQRLRQVLSLDDRLPLEWLVDGLPADQTLPPGLLPQYQTARRRLGRLLRENPTLKSLARAAEKALGIVRLVTVRKARPARRGGPVGRRKSQGFSVISRGRRANVFPDRVEATRQALHRLLSARNLAGPALHLQNRVRAWLARHIPGAPRNSLKSASPHG